MQRFASIFLPLLALTFFGGCASVTRGTKDTLVVESDPAGATVKLSTGAIGKTPTSFRLPRKSDLDVSIEKEGYESLVVHISAQISGSGAVGMAGNVLIGGLIGIGVDTYTGASKDLRPNPVRVTLVPLKVAAPPPAVSGPAVVATRPPAPTSPPGETVAPANPTVAAVAGSPAAVAPVPPPAPFLPTGVPVGVVFLPNTPDPERLGELIARVFTAREWEVREKGPDHVIGHIRHRSSEANLTLAFDEKEVRFFCEGWKIDKATGAHLEPRLPKSWIDNIKKDLSARIVESMPVAVSTAPPAKVP